jgi:APA family basic amino acid/polyamine antiporter
VTLIAVAGEPAGQPPTRLARRLGAREAVVIGLGSMIGAGIFSALGPAADVAGAGLLIGLAIAAIVAYCNATSSAQLAAIYPSSGGTYVYGRERLGHLWGFLAGWGFVVGKTASCAAIALAVVVAAGLSAGPSTANLGALTVGGVHGILQAAGLLFFAFAGYARIATLGEEVEDPRRTIPRAIPIALGITLLVYTTVATVALLAVGPEALAASAAPLNSVVRAGSFSWAVPVVRIGAAIASLGVLLSLLAGVSRTTFAMAGERDLPHWLSAVHPRHKVPHRAELTVAGIVVTVLCFADLRGAIGFSSFAVLVYYAIANASAWTLPRDQRRWPRAVSAAGLVGCAVVAVSLPRESVVGGLLLLALGIGVWSVRRWRSKPGSASEGTNRSSGPGSGD